MKNVLLSVTLVFLFCSCRYATPLIKFKNVSYVTADSSSIATHRQFYYPSITTHGWLGACYIDEYHGNNYRIDSSSITKKNSVVTPGSSRTHIRKKFYDSLGNLAGKSRTIEVVKLEVAGHFRSVSKVKNAAGKWIRTVKKGATKPGFISWIIN